MRATDPSARPRLPRLTSHALAMRPESRRVYAIAAVVTVVAATVIGALVAFAGDRIAARTSTAEALSAAFWGGIGALVAAVLGVSAVPVARRLLLRRADVRLIDAASPVHPLMKRLMAEAPGTYAHSVATANLAEAAAEAVGADALLARVGAYYHDIGKIRNPCYFFENLAQGENPHDGTSPSLSALLITAHVTDGLELAEEYELPERVVDIIREHHGTSLIRYFYHKATTCETCVSESDFRYHGGRPSSREAAIVMLADSCEAAVRALVQPSAEEIALVVRGVIEDKLDDHQLEHAGLTAEDLDLIASIFTRMLVGMLHARCAYPQKVSERSEEDHADQRREPSRA